MDTRQINSIYDMYTLRQSYGFLRDWDQETIMDSLHIVLKHRGKGNAFNEIRNEYIEKICEIFLKNGTEIEQLT